jgi:ADP-ribosylglycohydrolase
MMYGLAIGDALGAAVEFMYPGTFPPVTGYRGDGPHELDAGQWTDDTSMALALADSLAHGWSPKDHLERYVEWRRNGKYSVNGECFDIGNTTRDSIFNFELAGMLVNNPDDSQSGNGSIMRLAPIPIRYHDATDHELVAKARESSKTTHASVMCQDACAYLAVVLRRLMGDRNREYVLSRSFWDSIETPLHIRVDDIIDNSEKTPRGTGFVVDSLHAALWAFLTSESFEEAVLKAVNLGEDADTTGAVCGQLAGAYWGYDAIPQHLIDGLDRKDLIDLYLTPILA